MKYISIFSRFNFQFLQYDPKERKVDNIENNNKDVGRSTLILWIKLELQCGCFASLCNYKSFIS